MAHYYDPWDEPDPTDDGLGAIRGAAFAFLFGAILVAIAACLIG